MSGTYQGVVNTPNGIAGLDGSGLITSSVLPLATNSTAGAVTVDNSTVFSNGGVLSAWNGWRTTYAVTGESFTNGQVIVLDSGQFYDPTYIAKGVFSYGFNGSGPSAPIGIIEINIAINQGGSYPTPAQLIANQYIGNNGYSDLGQLNLSAGGGYFPTWQLTFTFNTDISPLNIKYSVQTFQG